MQSGSAETNLNIQRLLEANRWTSCSGDPRQADVEIMYISRARVKSVTWAELKRVHDSVPDRWFGSGALEDTAALKWDGGHKCNLGWIQQSDVH